MPRYKHKFNLTNKVSRCLVKEAQNYLCTYNLFQSDFITNFSSLNLVHVARHSRGICLEFVTSSLFDKQVTTQCSSKWQLVAFHKRGATFKIEINLKSTVCRHSRVKVLQWQHNNELFVNVVVELHVTVNYTNIFNVAHN